MNQETNSLPESPSQDSAVNSRDCIPGTQQYLKKKQHNPTYYNVDNEYMIFDFFSSKCEENLEPIDDDKEKNTSDSDTFYSVDSEEKAELQQHEVGDFTGINFDKENQSQEDLHFHFVSSPPSDTASNVSVSSISKVLDKQPVRSILKNGNENQCILSKIRNTNSITAQEVTTKQSKVTSLNLNPYILEEFYETIECLISSLTSSMDKIFLRLNEIEKRFSSQNK